MWPWTLTYQKFLLRVSSQGQELYSHQKLNGYHLRAVTDADVDDDDADADNARRDSTTTRATCRYSSRMWKEWAACMVCWLPFVKVFQTTDVLMWQHRSAVLKLVRHVVTAVNIRLEWRHSVMKLLHTCTTHVNIALPTGFVYQYSW